MSKKTNCINGFGSVILALALIFIFTACTPGNAENITDKTTDGSAADLNTQTKEPSLNETEGTDDPEPGDTEAADAKASIKKPEDILKDYPYYAVIDQPIEDFELKDLNGNTVKLSDYSGKIVFLNFWATWCPPCRDEMPYMQKFYDKYKDEDIVILAVNPAMVENQGMGDSKKAEKKVRKFIDDNKYTFPVLLDSEDTAWSFYQQRGIPANYIIDTEGMIKYLKPGAFSGVDEMEAFAEAVRAAGKSGE